MTDGGAALDYFARIVGARHVLADPADRAAYEADGRSTGGRALAILRPASTAEVSALVRAAAAHGITLVPQGARTGLVGAGLPSDDGLQAVLSLDRLNRPPVVDPVNRSVHADAGVLLSTLNVAAAPHGLFFPIDLGADPSVGGMVSANTGGARFLRYGDVRRSLLGLEVVLADGEGTVLDLGTPLWKNNTGLDLKQLWVGAAGSLGVVTRATLALQPRPASRVTALVALRRAETAADLLVALEQSLGTLVTAFEGISAPALRAALGHVPGLTDPFAGVRPDFALLIELSAGALLDEDMLEGQLAAALEPFMAGDDAAVLDVAIDRRDRLWAIRHAIPEALRAAGQVVACDIALRRGDVMAFRAEMIRLLADAAPGLDVHDFGHVGDGGLHFNMVWPKARGPIPSGLADRARGLVFQAVVDHYGGSFSAEHGVGPRNAGHYARFVPPTIRGLSGAVQRMLAPVTIGRVDFDGAAARKD